MALKLENVLDTLANFLYDICKSTSKAVLRAKQFTTSQTC